MTQFNAYLVCLFVLIYTCNKSKIKRLPGCLAANSVDKSMKLYRGREET